MLRLHKLDQFAAHPPDDAEQHASSALCAPLCTCDRRGGLKPGTSGDPDRPRTALHPASARSNSVPRGLAELGRCGLPVLPPACPPPAGDAAAPPGVSASWRRPSGHTIGAFLSFLSPWLSRAGAAPASGGERCCLPRGVPASALGETVPPALPSPVSSAASLSSRLMPGDSASDRAASGLLRCGEPSGCASVIPASPCASSAEAAAGTSASAGGSLRGDSAGALAMCASSST